MKTSLRISTLLVCATALLSVACAHHPVATVLPKGSSNYEIVAQGSNEQSAFQKAEEEANYTCEKDEKSLIVNDQDSVYQGPDKNSRDDVNGGNVALAYFTGRSGKERGSDDYKVTLMIACE